MNAVLRHFAIRVWTTAVAGGLLCLALLYWGQEVVGVRYQALLVSVILAGCFGAFGWAMNRTGMHFIGLQLKEAAVWERAGMPAEAWAALERAAAFYDSFWISPLGRRRQTRHIMGRLARFHLARPALGDRQKAFLVDYLQKCPDDAEVAEEWLTHAAGARRLSNAEQETATRLGDALVQNDRIQRLLFQIYLNSGRTDFFALQTYKRVWQQAHPMEDALLKPLARLFLSQARMSDWALQVYLAAYDRGEVDCLEGIAAAVHYLPPNADNRSFLAAAGKIEEGVPIDRRPGLRRRFKPTDKRPPSAVGHDRKARQPSRKAPLYAPSLNLDKRFGKLVAVWHRLAMAAGSIGGRSTAPAKTATIAAATAAALIIGLGAWHLLGSEGNRAIQAPPPVPELSPIVTDQFTIQVAAYLKVRDAERIVQQLRRNGLEAFYNEASSADRTWYQIKVSHFATKSEAQAYGEEMKAKGLIDDFYVANYTPPPAAP